jgi:Immunity protein 32
MITVEIKDATNSDLTEIEIYCDSEGLIELQRQLNFLLAGENHVHLATPSWAGCELNEEKHGKQNQIINQISIFKVPMRKKLRKSSV